MLQRPIVFMSVLSDEKRLHLVIAYKRNKSVSQTARECKCSRPTVRRWLKRYEETALVNAKRSSGRRASVPVGIGRVAADMLASGQHGGAKQVSMALWNEGRTKTAVHKTTLIRAARRESKEAGTSLVVRRGPPPRGPETCHHVQACGVRREQPPEGLEQRNVYRQEEVSF